VKAGTMIRREQNCVALLLGCGPLEQHGISNN
jgi:hypothetical protein